MLKKPFNKERLVIARSLADAMRAKDKPLILDLRNGAEDLKCHNLMCEKVGEPCICRLSHVLEALKDVRQLTLSGNGITDLPSTLFKLKDLRELDLSQNKLTHIPVDIHQLTNLQEAALTDLLFASKSISK